MDNRRNRLARQRVRKGTAVKYKVRYALGDKAIEVSKNNGLRVWVDCDEVGWKQPDPHAVANGIAEYLNAATFPTLLAAETERLGRKP